MLIIDALTMYCTVIFTTSKINKIQIITYASVSCSVLLIILSISLFHTVGLTLYTYICLVLLCKFIYALSALIFYKTKFYDILIVKNENKKC